MSDTYCISAAPYNTVHAFCTALVETFYLGLDRMEPLHLYLKRHVLPRFKVSSDLYDEEP